MKFFLQLLLNSLIVFSRLYCMEVAVVIQDRNALIRAAAREEAQSCYLYGKLLLQESGKLKESQERAPLHKKAFDWIRKAANKNYIPALLELGAQIGAQGQEEPNPQKKDILFNEAITLLGNPVLLNDAEAQNILATVYFDKSEIAQTAKLKLEDRLKAERAFGIAAKGGIANAQYNFSKLLQERIPHTPNKKERASLAKDAFYWLQQAAKQDHPKALNSLGVQYLNNYYTLDTPQGVMGRMTALNLFEKAANLGSIEAANNLGGMYRFLWENASAEDRPPFLDKALYWFEKAAEAGIAQAQAVLIDLYHIKAELAIDVIEKERFSNLAVEAYLKARKFKDSQTQDILASTIKTRGICTTCGQIARPQCEKCDELKYCAATCTKLHRHVHKQRGAPPLKLPAKPSPTP